MHGGPRGLTGVHHALELAHEPRVLNEHARQDRPENRHDDRRDEQLDEREAPAAAHCSGDAERARLRYTMSVSGGVTSCPVGTTTTVIRRRRGVESHTVVNRL